MRLAEGSQFAGYAVVSRLGRGGMATVYLVREAGLDRMVALKVLPEHLDDDPEFGGRFEQEARVIAGLDHPNIIPLYRFGMTDDVPWMALRYVDGGDFAARLAARPLAVPEGLEILHAVAAALDYAHRKGVIHRDLKPQNILLTRDGAAYLADFGVAKLLEGSGRLKTATGGILGTPAYMAPEQAQGLKLGPHTDIYALAIICFQWLTGSLPFDADTPHAILMKQVTQPPPRQALDTLSPPVAAVLERGLAKEPAERHASAGELVTELEQALYAPAAKPTATAARAALPPERPRPAPPPTPPHAAPAKRARWIVSLAFGALVAAFGGYVIWRESAAPPEPTPAPEPAPGVVVPQPEPAQPTPVPVAPSQPKPVAHPEPAPHAPAQPVAPPADRLIESYLAAHGGRARIGAVRSMLIVASVQFTNGTLAAVQVQIKRPGKIRVDSLAGNLTDSRGFDGRTGWVRSGLGGLAVPGVLTPGQLQDLKYQAMLGGPLFDHRARGIRVEYLGTEPVGGVDAHVLKISYPNNDTDRYYLDPHTFLESRVRTHHRVDGTWLDVEVDHGDYRSVGGFVLAHALKFTNRQYPQLNSRSVIEQYEFNHDPPDAVFTAGGDAFGD